ncbi:MAG: hypothetical protein M1121_00705 [Actinobacteria bacterium]|nr:hypothetical protein [Actinomycetota bacterium]
MADADRPAPIGPARPDQASWVICELDHLRVGPAASWTACELDHQRVGPPASWTTWEMGASTGPWTR